MLLTDLIPASDAASTAADDGQFPAMADAAAEMRAAQTGTVLVPLTHLSRLRAEGEDAASFLHNLMTNDVQGIPADGVRSAGFCSPKGRLLAAFTLWRDGDAVVLQLPRALAEPMRRKLSMYILRAKAKLGDASADLPALGLAGNGAEAALAAAGLPLPPAAMKQATAEGVSVLRLAADRFQIVTTPERLQAVWQALAAHATPAGTPAWRWFDIRDGLVSIWPATQEAFVPQMVNFELTGGVSFKKGCYPGQEVVARSQFRGTLKRRAFLAHSGVPLAAAQELFPESDREQPCGVVAQAAKNPQGGWDAIVSMQLAAVDAPVVTADGAQVALTPPPYPLLADI